MSDRGSLHGKLAETRPVWALESPPEACRPSLERSCRADVVVVGAGLAGLSTAFHLSRLRPTWDIIVLERAHVGAGASGVNTGFVGPGVGTSIAALRRHFGDAKAREMFAETLQAVERTESLAREEDIDCRLRRVSQLVCATTTWQARSLRRQGRALAELGFPVPILSSEELAIRFGHDAYTGALRYDTALAVDPLLLTRGLCGAAERAGVRVLENSAVERLSPGATEVEVGVGGGRAVRARLAILATDGYTPPAFAYGRRLVPLRTHVIATAPLRDDHLLDLAWDGRDVVIDGRNFFAYYRLSPQGRLVFGGGRVSQLSGRPARDRRVSEAAWRRLERELAALFPSLADIPIDARWWGMTAATADRLPVVGPLPGERNVFFCGAWSGHGLALSIRSGEWLATTIAGGRDGAQPWHRSHTATPTFGPFQRAVVSSSVAALESADRVGALWAKRPRRRADVYQRAESHSFESTPTGGMT